MSSSYMSSDYKVSLWVNRRGDTAEGKSGGKSCRQTQKETNRETEMERHQQGSSTAVEQHQQWSSTSVAKAVELPWVQNHPGISLLVKPTSCSWAWVSMILLPYYAT